MEFPPPRQEESSGLSGANTGRAGWVTWAPQGQREFCLNHSGTRGKPGSQHPFPSHGGGEMRLLLPVTQGLPQARPSG